MNKKWIILSIIEVFIIIGLLFCIWIVKDNKKCEQENSNSISKEEYYANMTKKMNAFYKVWFSLRNNIDSIDAQTGQIIISLKQLKTVGFPIEEFVSYDKTEACSLNESYAVKTIENNKSVIKVYYKCGNDSNYNPTSKNKD